MLEILPPLDPPTPKVRVEKNLNNLGFFAATYRSSTKDLYRLIELGSRDIDGQRTSQRAEIVGAARWGGLPSGSDRDMYYAFMKIVEERRKAAGMIENPVKFTSAELLSLLNVQPDGRQYRKLRDWVDRMINTGIKAEYAIYYKGRRKWASDTFHVFDRAVRMGEELEDGTRAECNYIWMSSWLLESINAEYLFPIDFQDYLSLRNDIARALFSHLDGWFYATNCKPFEKRYDDFCALLGIAPRHTAPLIRQQCNPSMQELCRLHYLTSWSVARIDSSTPPRFKIILVPGSRYYAVAREIPAPEVSPEELIEATNASLLVKQGIRSDVASKLASELVPEFPLADQLEYFEYLKATMGKRMQNPTGFLVHLLRNPAPLPPDFLARRERKQLQAPLSPEEQASVEETLRQMELRSAYAAFFDGAVSEYRSRHADTVAGFQTAAMRRIRKEQPDLLGRGQGYFASAVQRDVEASILKAAKIPSFDDWCAGYRQTSLF